MQSLKSMMEASPSFMTGQSRGFRRTVLTWMGKIARLIGELLSELQECETAIVGQDPFQECMAEADPLIPAQVAAEWRTLLRCSKADRLEANILEQMSRAICPPSVAAPRQRHHRCELG